MKMKFLSAAVICSLMISCASNEENKMFKPNIPDSFPKSFWMEGHRGARGLSPENTIPSMIKAIDHGANFIEVDLYLTKDEQILVAHDPLPNFRHTLYEDGTEITADDAKKFVFHQMNYEDIKKFDVGSKFFETYPEQEKIKVSMPLFGEMIDSVEAYTKTKGLQPVVYNIELKTSPYYDSIGYNATPQVLVDKLMELIKSKNIGDRYYIQSFDKRVLVYSKEKYPQVPLGFLTGDGKVSMSQHLDELGFLPDMYIPAYGITTKELIDSVHAKGMKFVNWTVNEKADMQRLIEWGVDGIITDYMDRLDTVVNKK
ncbi:glycerophosphodiester phosphodiesterase family protein [Gynurincola endophyticus]|uniref:glycerophosphodiester phosphodiesterase family protein n=1 Tax=Gynurincola endophyticus TaxID=2479004 RepID=UPI000F8CFA9A|nr:glycerophosphodiester phosphodiesterase family protein [Gynurincola endophyticus]